MALIKCPDCGKEHSDLAPACPQCGRPANNGYNYPQKLAELSRKSANAILVLLKSPKSVTLTVLMGLISLAALPRAIKYGLLIWDPLQKPISASRTFWHFDGGYEYECTSIFGSDGRSTGCWDLGGDNILKQCQEESEKVYGYNPNDLPKGIDIINAVPQDKNVSGGACKGTLYMLRFTATIPGYEILQEFYCKSPLVKYKDDKQYHIARIGEYYWFPPGPCRDLDYWEKHKLDRIMSNIYINRLR